jgi:squalene synthase HpnC
MAVDHYENFPVASVLLPARLRPAVETIYAFARSADDFADEGDAPAHVRLQQLENYEDELDLIERNENSNSQLFRDLKTVIAEHDLPLQAFRDLLSAFKQDVVTASYADFGTLLDYCRRSANPVGNLMLHLYKAASSENLRQSDAICSALQLINFWQDVAIDIAKQRIYLPQEDLQRFRIDVTQIAEARVDLAWQNMMRFQTTRARDMLISGQDLCKVLPGRLGWELRLVVQGGLRILQKIDQVDGDVFRHRPKLRALDWPLLLWRAFWM